MPIRFSLNLTLGAILVSTIALGNIHPAIAQYRDRFEDFDPHYYCDGLARDRSERYSQGDGIGNIVDGAVGGAITGAIIGAITGDVGKGAGIGAVSGGYRGSRESRNDKKALYRREYDACMRRNGR